MASYVRTQEIDHTIGASGRFTLRITSWDVELRQTDGEDARVRIEFDIRAGDDAEADAIFERVKFRVGTGAGFLEVTEPKRVETGLGALVRLLGGGAGHVGARVVAELPARTHVTYAGVSADLTATGLVGAQEYKTVSGDAVLSDTGGEIRISSVSGDVSLRGVAPTALHANSVSGDVTAFAPRIERARVVTVSGDIELEGELAEAGEHRVETVSGDLTLGAVNGLSLEVRGLSTDVEVSLPHRSEGSRDRRRYIIGAGGPALLFSSMSGDVSVGPARRFESRISAPRPPSPPTAPTPPAPPIDEDAQLAVLRALEAGEIDVEEATRRLSGGEAGG